MKKLAVISGKGGTGKTTFAANLALITDSVMLADCDVDAPNLHLLLSPEIIKSQDFYGARLAVKDADRCSDCGLCRELCHFQAIDAAGQIMDYKCEGCGLCVACCPERALKLVEHKTGDIFFSSCRSGSLVHARLKIGAENSGKLVSRVKTEAEKWAAEQGQQLVIIDGSPGVGCPVIASLSGADGALLISEPTLSGISDLKRIADLLEHFSIPGYLIINKHDINEELTDYLIDYCQERNIPLWAKVPFDTAVVRALERGEPVLEYSADSPFSRQLKQVKAMLEERILGK